MHQEIIVCTRAGGRRARFGQTTQSIFDSARFHFPQSFRISFQCLLFFGIIGGTNGIRNERHNGDDEKLHGRRHNKLTGPRKFVVFFVDASESNARTNGGKISFSIFISRSPRRSPRLKWKFCEIMRKAWERSVRSFGG